ncbi:hypothetical protein R3P38DRAFT_2549489 [Favolaschia claudopus]|uniref:Integrase catalytic domain-containing protein n=1 Tax=Favolaschia claudopus TaxID=2862362 RepID=A0AAW0AID0_9AGAR
MDRIPERLPQLPRNPQSGWNANVLLAYQSIAGSFNHASMLIHQEDGDQIQLNLASETLMKDTVPLLETLESEGVPTTFVHECARAIGPLVCELKLAALAAQGIERQNVTFLEPVEEVRTGKRGRPKKQINEDLLREACAKHRNISQADLARSLGVHRSVLAKKMKAAGISKKYDAITDDALDTLVRDIKRTKPLSGRRYIIGALRTRGLRVQKERVRQSLARVDALGQMLRKRQARRRPYRVPRPNYLWHCDGHHKLIWWGIVIHGFIDGYCRTVLALKASTNNRASTVLAVFKEAIATYGKPSRVRGDRGGENVKVSVWMIIHRGPNRASFMWGSSTHNTRIERLWVEVGTQFARQWRAFFTRLGDLHCLDRKNPGHIWLLHQLFLDSINEDCVKFQNEWNAHPVSGRQCSDRSPNDMRFLGELNQGVYPDPMEGVHPDTINRYYGVERGERTRRAGQTGAGHSDDEEDSDGDVEMNEPEELVNAVTDDLAHNVRHPAVKVARHQNPFRSPETEQAFRGALAEVIRQGIVPQGYGVRAEEWEDGTYPAMETINPGTRGKEMVIALPRDVWLPRAVLFAQALDVMTRCLLLEEANLGPIEEWVDEDDDDHSSSGDAAEYMDLSS